MVGDKQIPANLEAEKALLGSILIDNEAIGSALEVLRAEDFYHQGHRLAFERMVAMSESNKPIDLVTISEALAIDGLLQKAGGAAYLAGLTDGVPFGAGTNVTAYAKIIKAKSKSRQVIHIAQEILTRALDQGIEPSEIVGSAVTDLLALEAVGQGDVSTFQQAAVTMLKKLQEKHLPKVCTGIKGVDEMTGGFLPGELVIVSAQKGTGKTLLAQQTRRWACRHGLHSLFASCEMPSHQLAGREMATAAGLPHKLLRWPDRITREQFGVLASQVSTQCQKCTIQHGVLSIAKIASAARKLKADGRLGLLTIDYDELVSAPGRDEIERLSNVAMGAWQLAVSLQVPVILISQIRKSSRDGTAQSSAIDDLYGSSAKGKHATTVLRVHRDFDKVDSWQELQPASVGVAKNRFGDLGWTDVWFSRSRLEFLNKESGEENRAA